MPDPFSSDSTHQQLVREAKIGLSIVLIVLVSVVFWSFHHYHRIHHEVPDHILNAPVARQVGPDGYLSHNEVDQSAANRSTPALSVGATLSARDRPESQAEKLSKTARTVAFESDREPPDAGSVKMEESESAASRVDGLRTASAPSTVLVSLTEKVDRLEKLTESLLNTNSYASPYPPPIDKSRNPRERASRDISSALPDFEEPTGKRGRERRKQDAKASPAENPANAFKPERPRAITPQDDHRSSEVARQDVEIKTVDHQQELVDREDPAVDSSVPVFRVVEDRSVQPAPSSTSARRLSDILPSMQLEDGGTYQTRPGDSFWSIAERKYGDGRFFRALYEHNRSKVVDFEEIPIQTIIKTPSLDYLKAQYPHACPPDQVAGSDQQRIYTTRDGDTLFDIARRTTGQASRYLELLKLNRDRLPMEVNHLTRLPPDIPLALPR